MSFWDKLMGRGKKAAGDVPDDPSLRREGAHQEAEGMAEDRAESAEESTQAASEHEQDATISGSGYPSPPPKRENK